MGDDFQSIPICRPSQALDLQGVGLCHSGSFKGDVCPSNKFYLIFAVRKPLKEQEAGSDRADVSLDLAALKGMRLV